MPDGPKVYRSDTAVSLFTKQIMGEGQTWILNETAGGFVLMRQDLGSKSFMGWTMSRDEVADMWEMIGEALHHG